METSSNTLANPTSEDLVETFSKTVEIIVGGNSVEDAEFHYEVFSTGRIIAVVTAGTIQFGDKIKLILSDGSTTHFSTNITSIEPRSATKDLVEIDVEIPMTA